MSNIAKHLMLHGRTSAERQLGRQLMRGARPGKAMQLALDTAEKILAQKPTKTSAPIYEESQDASAK